jgi:uncharacterized protein YyaL (SSP411 family)
MRRHPGGFGRFLSALDFHLGPVVEVAMAWPSGAGEESRTPLLREVFARYLPNRVVAGTADGAQTDLPLLAGKLPLRGQATAYVCERYACQAPTVEPAELGRQLDARGGRLAEP